MNIRQFELEKEQLTEVLDNLGLEISDSTGGFMPEDADYTLHLDKDKTAKIKFDDDISVAFIPASLFLKTVRKTEKALKTSLFTNQ